MDRDTAVRYVRDRFSNIEEQTSRIIREFTLVQDEFELKEPRPWFLLKTVDLAVTPDAYVDLPGDFLSELDTEHGGFAFVHDESGLHRLEKKPFDWIFRNYSAQVGPPVYYDIIGTKIWTYPTPDQQYTITLNYYGKDVSVAEANITNMWLTYAPNILIAGASIPLCQYARRHNEITIFASQLNSTWNEVIKDTIQRRETNVGRQFGPPT